MTTSIGMLVIASILFGCGVYLVMERSILKALLGLLLLTNSVNLLLLGMGGRSGGPPIVGRTSEAHSSMADPLVQALILTAIVISMGLSAFVIALIYRSFTLQTREDVDDDDEDKKLPRRTRAEAPDYELPKPPPPVPPEGPHGPPVDGSDTDFDRDDFNGSKQGGDRG
ncbi:Na(+)/H(+) antiporter subunit C [Hoyosella sp. G463]|uniref:Na(+)/H(+) antiporter subunit C n=1 Tax=Lolliginicoccus lacisalsi TaxID=2742202 RepID=A0A927PLZ1_9ACTN|nr:Na(+)/H(+) antiporter subunit C [Lolliginicoccus lacisalsi]MBD8507378.1 Na(+)/H(+) antiporter subunit C [Lolliginicoccus lacisalsi]